VSATIAAQMFGADFLKLRKKRSIVIWALVLALLPVIVFYAVNAAEHASNASHEAAGGIESFHTGVRLLGGLFFGPLVAILIGVEAGTTDSADGVLRDLIVTGRSRLALFASRVPAALALCWAIVTTSYALILIGTFAFADGLPTPNGSMVLEGWGFVLLATGVLCAVAVGFSSLIDSRPGAIIALIAWQVIASPLISSISSLGGGRHFVLSQAIAHFGPAGVKDAHGTEVVMAGGTAALVLVLWLVVFLGLGAWRSRTMDA
jgi:ABC-type transport system involved in multi-copper enzyme maturation permease subunit